MIDALNFTSEEAYNEAVYAEQEDGASDGYRNEGQRALAHSRNTIQYPNDRIKIDAMVAQGRFVIAHHYCVYCPYTDAFIGTATSVVSDHATREEAQTAFTPLDAESDSDFYYALYPFERQAEPKVASKPNATETDDIPF